MHGDVLFLCQFFYPEYNSSATLPWDTAKYLVKSGLHVGAMCGYPKEYNNDSKVPEQEVKEKVSIKRLHYIQLQRGKKISRLINYFSFTLSILMHLSELKNYKCIIVYSNPPILPVVAILANRIFGTKIVFVSYDVYPEVAYASGNLSEDGCIAKAMQLINRKLCYCASTVVALTDEMKEFLLSNRESLPPNHVTVIPNWAHEGKREKTTEALIKFGYSSEDFIVSYFGNMGICQDMDTLLQAMDLLKKQDFIKFFIVGHGGKKEQVIEKTRHLKNVQVLDFLTGEEFEQAVSISSCSIVSLENGLKGMCAPSKYYSYLQAGVPVIAIVEQDSYLATEITREEIGQTVAVGDARGLANAIEKLATHENIRYDMADRAEKLYQEKYESRIGLEKYATLLKQLIGINDE